MGKAPSLLTPTVVPLPLARMDWIALAAISIAAWLARAALMGSNPYTAEAAHFVLARDLWHPDVAFANLYNDGRGGLEPLFWQRPFFSLLLAPGAMVSFAAYRMEHLLLAGLLPGLATALLLQLGTRRWMAWPVGLAFALHPLLVPWGTLALPDALMAVLCLGGLLAAHHGRPLATGLLLLAACWTKEVAIVTVLPLAALAVWRDPEGTPSRAWPVRLGRFPTALVATALLCFLPLLYSLSKPGATFPGWGVGGDGNIVLEKLFLLLWLAPLPLFALRFSASRRLALVSLAWSAFFLAYRFVLGRTLEAWYYVLPATLVLMAAAAGLSEASKSGPRPQQVAAKLVALAVAGLLAFQIVAPDHDPLKASLVTPLSGVSQWSLEQALAFERVRDDDFQAVVDALRPDDRRLLTLDVDWSFSAHPLSGHASVLYTHDGAAQVGWRIDTAPLADGIENRTDAVVLHKVPNPVNEAVRAVYADCIVLENEGYALLRGAPCPGRAEALRAAVYGPS